MVDNDLSDIHENMEKNKIFSSSNRLIVMLLLKLHSKVQFNEFMTLMKITPGNLDHHLKMLESANFIIRKPSILSRKVKVMIEITELGESELSVYLDTLKSLIRKLES